MKWEGIGRSETGVVILWWLRNSLGGKSVNALLGLTWKHCHRFWIQKTVKTEMRCQTVLSGGPVWVCRTKADIAIPLFRTPCEFQSLAQYFEGFLCWTLTSLRGWMLSVCEKFTGCETKRIHFGHYHLHYFLILFPGLGPFTPPLVYNILKRKIYIYILSL